MAVVWIPPLLRRLTHGDERVTVPGRTMRQIVEGLEAAYPGLRDRLCDGDQVRPEIAVVVDGEVTARGLLEPVEEEAEVHFIPAVSGGGWLAPGTIDQEALGIAEPAPLAGPAVQTDCPQVRRPDLATGQKA